MAERSFAEEVGKLRLGAGDTFTGEGILAITKALLENGVGYVGGYQGAPISHLMDVLADAEEILAELGVRYEANASEAAATAMLAASVHYPIRGAVTYKGPVGVNVGSDALANLASSGVTGGALIIVGEDYGEGSSIMQERSHAFAMKSQVWLLDPRPQPALDRAGGGSGLRAVRSVEHARHADGADPVMPRHRHVSDARQPAPPADGEGRAGPSAQRFQPRRAAADVLRAGTGQGEEPLAAAQAFITAQGLNERFGPDAAPVGILLQGGMYNGVIRALQRLGLADLHGETQVPLYVLNVTYPLVPDEFLTFCDGKEAVLVIEEGQPEFLEQAFAAMLYRAGHTIRLHGKDVLPMGGRIHRPGDAGRDRGLPAQGRARLSARTAPRAQCEKAPVPDLSKTVPIRPPGFCTGCPNARSSPR